MVGAHMEWERGEESIAGLRFLGRKKIRIRVMALWEKVAFPVRRAWVFLASRVKGNRNSGAGIMKLHNDVQTCGYQDVQVMWEMLTTEMELPPHKTKHRRPLWDVLIWSAGQHCAVEQKPRH